jgi:hypothetical protein
MFLGNNGILQSAKRFCEVDLDLWGQNITFFFQALFVKILMSLWKKAFREVLNNFAKWI